MTRIAVQKIGGNATEPRALLVVSCRIGLPVALADRHAPAGQLEAGLGKRPGHLGRAPRSSPSPARELGHRGLSPGRRHGADGRCRGPVGGLWAAPLNLNLSRPPAGPAAAGPGRGAAQSACQWLRLRFEQARLGRARLQRRQLEQRHYRPDLVTGPRDWTS